MTLSYPSRYLESDRVAYYPNNVSFGGSSALDFINFPTLLHSLNVRDRKPLDGFGAATGSASGSAATGSSTVV